MVCIQNQTFGQATSIAAFFGNEVIDGILGLAFTDLAINHIVPPFINAVDQHIVDLPIFTVYLSRLIIKYYSVIIISYLEMVMLSNKMVVFLLMADWIRSIAVI
jgi:hypothetical protein